MPSGFRHSSLPRPLGERVLGKRRPRSKVARLSGLRTDSVRPGGARKGVWHSVPTPGGLHRQTLLTPRPTPTSRRTGPGRGSVPVSIVVTADVGRAP